MYSYRLHYSFLLELVGDSHLDLKLWSDLLCRTSQQYYCSAATPVKHGNLVSHTDLTAEVSLRTLKHVNSLAISTLARQKMPFSLEFMLYWLKRLKDARKPFCFFKHVRPFTLSATTVTKHCVYLFHFHASLHPGHYQHERLVWLEKLSL